MEEFKIVYRVDTTCDTDDHITWEPECPLLFEAIQISRNTRTGQAFLQGKLRNISGETAQSFKATATVEYEDGAVESIAINPLDADIVPGSAYVLEPATLKRGDAVRASGIIERVKLIGGAWNSSASPSAIPRPQSIGLSQKAITERYKQVWAPLGGLQSDADASTIADNRLEKHDGWWLCPCGQVNVGREACVQCAAPFEVLAANATQDEVALESAAIERENQKKQAADLRDKKKRRIRRKVRRAAIIGVAAIIAIVVIGYCQYSCALCMSAPCASA